MVYHADDNPMVSIYETTDDRSQIAPPNLLGASWTDGDGHNRSVEEDCRQEQVGYVPGWPVEWTRVDSGTCEAVEFTQQRHSDWRPPSRSLILNTRNLQYRPAQAQNGPKSPRPFWPEREHDPPTDGEGWGSAGIPVKWVELSGFPRRATEKILKSFHAVGTILQMRDTPDAIRLRYLDRMGLYRAMQLDGKRIYGFYVVVKPILGDPQASDPIVYPTKPQFPHMHASRTQRIVELCDWKGKLRSFVFAFFLLFALFLRSIWW